MTELLKSAINGDMQFLYLFLEIAIASGTIIVVIRKDERFNENRLTRIETLLKMACSKLDIDTDKL